MKKIDNSKMENINGGSFWSALACGAGIGLILTGAGSLPGVVLTAYACGTTIAD